MLEHLNWVLILEENKKNNDNLLLKSKTRTIINYLLKSLLILSECAALVLSCAVINVFSEENAYNRMVLDTGEVFTSSIGRRDLDSGVDKTMQEYEEYLDSLRWKGPVLSKRRGTITGPSGKETYYNLNMAGVVNIMRRMGNNDEYWVRDDGVKMLGDYVMVAANLNLRPRGSLIETSLGMGIVCDTGGFAARNPTQLDIAVTW